MIKKILSQLLFAGCLLFLSCHFINAYCHCDVYCGPNYMTGNDTGWESTGCYVMAGNAGCAAYPCGSTWCPSGSTLVYSGESCGCHCRDHGPCNNHVPCYTCQTSCIPSSTCESNGYLSYNPGNYNSTTVWNGCYNITCYYPSCTPYYTCESYGYKPFATGQYTSYTTIWNGCNYIGCYYCNPLNCSNYGYSNNYTGRYTTYITVNSGCGYNIGCYQCNPLTCSDYGYSSSYTSGSTTKIVSNGCNSNLTCYQCATTCPSGYSFTCSDTNQLSANPINILTYSPSTGTCSNSTSCYQCTTVSDAWWQVVTGTVYAASNIDDKIGCTGSNCSPYLIRSSNTCPGSVAMTASIPISSSESSGYLSGTSNYTQRSAITTNAAPSLGAPVTTGLREDYEYFQNRVDYAALASNDLQAGDSVVHLVTGDLTINSSNSSTYTHATAKHVYFITGNLTFGEGASIPTSVGGYTAFIVKGNVTFSKTLGLDVTSSSTTTCATQGQGAIQAVVIADGTITVEANAETDKVCDKKLIVEGTYVSWTGNIKLPRTFKWCSYSTTAGSAYTDYNATQPVTTFIYRPDLLLNTPTWMRNTKMVRVETN